MDRNIVDIQREEVGGIYPESFYAEKYLHDFGENIADDKISTALGLDNHDSYLRRYTEKGVAYGSERWRGLDVLTNRAAEIMDEQLFDYFLDRLFEEDPFNLLPQGRAVSYAMQLGRWDLVNLTLRRMKDKYTYVNYLGEAGLVDMFERFLAEGGDKELKGDNPINIFIEGSLRIGNNAYLAFIDEYKDNPRYLVLAAIKGNNPTNTADIIARIGMDAYSKALLWKKRDNDRSIKILEKLKEKAERGTLSSKDLDTTSSADVLQFYFDLNLIDETGFGNFYGERNSFTELIRWDKPEDYERIIHLVRKTNQIISLGSYPVLAEDSHDLLRLMLDNTDLFTPDSFYSISSIDKVPKDVRDVAYNYYRTHS